jgi:hypothetical protein
LTVAGTGVVVAGTVLEADGVALLSIGTVDDASTVEVAAGDDPTTTGAGRRFAMNHPIAPAMTATTTNVTTKTQTGIGRPCG